MDGESSSTDAHSGWTPAGINPWVIAFTVTLATFMEVLDTSIANVALPHIAGSLSVSVEESTWVLTSYLVANAIVLPLSGWLSMLMGRKRFYMTCVVLFTISSALCGLATSMEQLVFFRVLQGLGGGGLQPSEQAVLVDTFPPLKRGMAMAVYAVAILVAPILGPTLGGWITDNYSWRWIFFINVPVGILSVVLSGVILQDPPYLKSQRAERKKHPQGVDYIGLSLLALGLGCLEIVLDRGQTKDWFGSPMIVYLTLTMVVSLVVVVFWELYHPNPIVNLRLFTERNFLFASVGVFCAFAVLFGSTVLLPQMLQTLMGYSALNAGLVLSPAGIVTMLEMPIIGFLLAKRLDARWLMMVGMATVAFASFWMAGLNLTVSPEQVIIPRCVQTLGAGMMIVPINAVAYLYIPRSQLNNASGLYNLVRNEGSSIGVAVSTTLLQRRMQFHHVRLSEHIHSLNPMAGQWMSGISGYLHQSGVNPAVARSQGLRLMDAVVQQQAAAMSFLDLFWLFGMLSLVVIPIFLFMKRSVPRGGEIAVH